MIYVRIYINEKLSVIVDPSQAETKNRKYTKRQRYTHFEREREREMETTRGVKKLQRIPWSFPWRILRTTQQCWPFGRLQKEIRDNCALTPERQAHLHSGLRFQKNWNPYKIDSVLASAVASGNARSSNYCHDLLPKPCL